MMDILHFRKQLVGPPPVAPVAGIVVRTMVLPEDVAAWLALRKWAMARQTPVVRPWSPDDFQAEMALKPWWRPERSWLAIAGDVAGHKPTASLVGSVTLAERKEAPVVHWLLVDPAWRRRGVGRLLMSHLERAAWDAGRREVQLETHSGWAEAVRFYQSIGYEPVRDPSPR